MARYCARPGLHAPGCDCAVMHGNTTGEIRSLTTTTKESIPMTEPDLVNHPPHYRHASGVECIQITRQCHGDMSAAIQYVWRYNNKGTPGQDLAKARWYLRDIIDNGLGSHPPFRARDLLLEVVIVEADQLKRALLFNIAQGHLSTAIKLITAHLGDAAPTTETEH